MKKNFIGFLFLVPLLITACTVPYDDLNTAPSSLTPGVVKTEIVTGETTQAEVLEVFGPPDLVTVDKGIELWGYDKISRETAYSSFGILAGGLAGPAVAGGVVRGGRPPKPQRPCSSSFISRMTWLSIINLVPQNSNGAKRGINL